jgi:hypothetical protein
MQRCNMRSERFGKRQSWGLAPASWGYSIAKHSPVSSDQRLAAKELAKTFCPVADAQTGSTHEPNVSTIEHNNKIPIPWYSERRSIPLVYVNEGGNKSKLESVLHDSRV